MADLVITAKKVSGHCAAGIREGDRIVLRGSTVSLTETDKLCGFAFANIYPVVFAARLGKDLKELGLAGRMVQCIDPGPEFGGGGTVQFEIRPLDEA